MSHHEVASWDANREVAIGGMVYAIDVRLDENASLFFRVREIDPDDGVCENLAQVRIKLVPGESYARTWRLDIPYQPRDLKELQSILRETAPPDLKCLAPYSTGEVRCPQIHEFTSQEEWCANCRTREEKP